jgi:hypothetical protein
LRYEKPHPLPPLLGETSLKPFCLLGLDGMRMAKCGGLKGLTPKNVQTKDLRRGFSVEKTPRWISLSI